VKKKRISGQAKDKNKQTIYIALKSKIKSRADYAPEPAQWETSACQAAEAIEVLKHATASY